MGRKSRLSERQWEIVARRVRQNEPLRKIAKDFGMAESSIRGRMEKEAKQALDMDKEKSNFSATAKPGYVYVIAIQDSGSKFYYKIGMTENVEKRVAAHQTSLPFELKVICSYYVLNMCEEEKSLHKEYKAKCVRGEWFVLEPEDIERIANRSLLEKPWDAHQS